MKLRREWLEELIFGKEIGRRFTQDSPVLPDVWIEFGVQYTDPARGKDKPRDLLMTPHRGTTPAELARELRTRLRTERERRPQARSLPAGIAYNQAAVAATVRFDELVRVVLPMSAWWHDHVRLASAADFPKSFARPDVQREIAGSIKAADKGRQESPEQATMSPDLVWMIHVVGTILLAEESAANTTDETELKEAFTDLVKREDDQVERFAALMSPPPETKSDRTPYVWLVSHNRGASAAVWRSTLTVKSDAAQRLFKLECRNLSWAILDSGIDARHPAFWKRSVRDEARRAPVDEWPKLTRVKATYDFTRIRHLLSADEDDAHAAIKSIRAELKTELEKPRQARLESDLAFWKRFVSDDEDTSRRAAELRKSLESGRVVDWDAVTPFIQVPHVAQAKKGETAYAPPLHDHGTHVAGILAADWRTFDWDPADLQHPGEHDLIGVCPDIGLYDFRVLDEAGQGDEFTIMAALQFVRHLNAHREQPLIHGVNMSLAIPHDKANYACGRTPICDECERVIGTGVVVVAAAGNKGYIYYTTPAGVAGEGYAAISIQDPGNAESVITVGATHRYQPHTYGVSYFSSRGPTGDGRRKPDLVAPGEKILGPIPDYGSTTKDGTSMAAPHVSGAAALLLARHRELLGNPRRIKDILCKSATDLGRERDFQGYGMVDILRALQSV